MNDEPNFRIIIIDDNPAIHDDFIKILTTNYRSSDVDQLEAEILGDNTDTAAKVAMPETATLPHFQIDTATQGQEGVLAIKKALDENNPYALAFVDIRMPPGWDGIETIQRIWEIDEQMQVVICTAYSDYTWEETVQRLGTSDNLLILKKPFDNVAVRQLAWALTRKWQVMNESRKRLVSIEQSAQERTDSLQQSLSLTRATLESSTDGIMVVNDQGEIIDYNAQWAAMWQLPNKIAAKKDYKLFLDHVVALIKESDEFLSKIDALSRNPEEISMDTFTLYDGRVFECYSQPHKLNKMTIGRVWSFRDATQRVVLEQKLEYQATHDMLTGLPNRVLLHDRIVQTMARVDRHQSLMGVLFFDLDRFKLINDSLTHQAGDELLMAIASRLSAVLRKEDTISRLGGDEFVVLSSLANTEEDIIVFASKLLTLLRKPFKVMGKELYITASIGISLYPQDGNSAGELLKNADLAMYRAKELGGNQFQFYTSSLNENALARLEQEAELRRAIDKQEFVLYYQPQTDVVTEKVVSVEALIRWRHPTRGIVLPMDFIRLAEESGLIVPIGEWVIKTACQQVKAWHDAGLPKIRVAINVTTVQFQQENFVSLVQQTLNEVGLSPEYLEIELTENVVLANTNLVEITTKLKALGVQIVLDDFGIENSSFNYLKKIPIDRLKIDRSFLQGVSVSENKSKSAGDEFNKAEKNNGVIVQAIIAMAHSLNLNVVAEGIETASQLTFLEDQHCESVQGYYISKPLGADELENFLKARK